MNIQRIDTETQDNTRSLLVRYCRLWFGRLDELSGLANTQSNNRPPEGLTPVRNSWFNTVRPSLIITLRVHRLCTHIIILSKPLEICGLCNSLHLKNKDSTATYSSRSLHLSFFTSLSFPLSPSRFPFDPSPRTFNSLFIGS